MVVTQVVEIPRASSSGKRKTKPVIIKWKSKPVIIKWKSKPFLRSQSINVAINDIYETSRSMDFCKINLIGQSGSGKSTLSFVLSHSLHVLDPSFSVHHLKDEDLIHFEDTMKRLPNGNLICVFDDLSEIVSKFGKSALDKLRGTLTRARHYGDVGRKLIIILNYHSQKQLDKVLRISSFTFYTECLNEEISYFEEYLGKECSKQIKRFVKLRAQARMYHKFSFKLSKGNTFTYKDSDPYRLLLYNNSISTRFVVSPTLEFITEGKVCQVCYPAKVTEANTKNLEKFVEDYSKQFGKGVAKRAVELKLLSHGIQVQPKRVLQAQQYIERFLAAKEINLKELADKFGLKERTTKLFPDKQPSQEALA